MSHCHASDYGGHATTDKTVSKILQASLYWPNIFKDVHDFIKKCDQCQRTENISNRNEMPINNILYIEIFDVWRIDFMGPFPSYMEYEYILVVVDYVPKWIEAISSPTNSARVMIKMLKNNFPKAWGS